WEGGMRVPAIAWWPGKIKPGVTSTPANAMDIFPTVLALAGVTPPSDRPIDGTNLGDLLTKGAALPERPFFYYRGLQLFACRLGAYKAHFQTQAGYGQPKSDKPEIPLLYNLAHDPSERFDIAKQHPEVLERIKAVVAEHSAGMKPGVNQIDDPSNPNPAKKGE
ncbi:MAG: sulfatase-like hydrolase/transferase, partial [Verrucomicrobiota bacterium]